MNKAQKKARFEAMNGRQGISERIMEIASEIIKVGSYKRAVIGAGQIRLLAELAEADCYWSEKASYGYQVENDISNGARKCTFSCSGSTEREEIR